MATLKSISAAELSEARRAGFKRKKPKKGKLKTMSAVEAYIARWNNWVDAARDRVRTKRKAGTDKEKFIRLRALVRRHSS